jgi:hypothetical protein
MIIPSALLGDHQAACLDEPVAIILNSDCLQFISLIFSPDRIDAGGKPLQTPLLGTFRLAEPAAKDHLDQQMIGSTSDTHANAKVELPLW